MKQPKFCMCMVCGDVLYAGPSIYPIPRDCSCQATRVVPTEERGHVQWDVERYKAAALVDAETQRDQLLRQAGSEEADKLKSLGFSQQEVIEGAKDAIRKAQPLAQKLYQEVLDNAPKEPEVEYTDESLDPTAMVKLERSPSIDEFYEYEMSKLERGEQV